MHPFVLIMYVGTFFTAISQVLLKQSAEKPHRSFLAEYLNWRVILAYGISFTVLLFNTYAFTQVEYKYGAVIDTVSYVFVLALSYFLLKERFSKGQLIGNLLIITGVLVYTL